jgi:hypothetical protein
VIFGTQCRTARTRLALGSLVGRAARGAHCAVVVIDADPQEPAGAAPAIM